MASKLVSNPNKNIDIQIKKVSKKFSSSKAYNQFNLNHGILRLFCKDKKDRSGIGWIATLTLWRPFWEI